MNVFSNLFPFLSSRLLNHLAKLALPTVGLALGYASISSNLFKLCAYAVTNVTIALPKLCPPNLIFVLVVLANAASKLNPGTPALRVSPAGPSPL